MSPSAAAAEVAAGLLSEQAVEAADGGWARTGAARGWQTDDQAIAPRAGSQDRRLAWLEPEPELAVEVEFEVEVEVAVEFEVEVELERALA